MLELACTTLTWLTLYGVAGLVMARVFGRACRRAGPAASATGPGTLVALGMAFFGFSGFLLSAAGLRAHLPLQLLALLVLLLLPTLRGVPATVTTPAPGAASAWTRGLAAAVLVLLVARLVEIGYVSGRWPLCDWDALAIWGFKAKVLFHEPIRGSAYFFDLTKSYSHVDYPLMLALLEAQVYQLRGVADDTLVKALFPVVYLALMASFVELGTLLAGRRPALVFGAGLLAVGPVCDLATTGQADVLLSLFLLQGVGQAMLWRETGALERLCLAAVFGAAAAFTKNEGLPALALMAAVWGLLPLVWPWKQRPDRAARGRLLRVALLTVALIGPWLAFRSFLPKTVENYGSRLGLAELAAGVARLPVIWRHFLGEFTSWREWHVLWLLPPAALALAPRILLTGARLRLLVFILGMMAVYTGVYMITPWPVETLLSCTRYRLLAHLAPLTLLLAATVADALGRQAARRSGLPPPPAGGH